MTNWNDLPDEMKGRVVEEMNFETRTRLKLCSKADKCLVESIPMPFDKLNIEVWNVEGRIIANISISDDKLPEPALKMQLVADEGVFVILNTRKADKNIQCSSVEDARKRWIQLFESIVFKSNFRFEWIHVYIMYRDFLMTSDFTIHTKNLIMKGTASQTSQWLKNVAPGASDVSAGTFYDEKIEGLGNIPAIRDAITLHVDCVSDITDEQLLTFKCLFLNIPFESNITARGMNQFIKKMIAEDYPKDTRFKIHVKPNIMSQIWDDVVEGLDVSKDSSEETGQIIFGKGQIKMRYDKALFVMLAVIFQGELEGIPDGLFVEIY